MTDLPRTAGRLVAAPLGAIARRRGGKPMHPRGAVFDGVLERAGTEDSGAALPAVPWLAGAGSDRVLARLSRGAGLPTPLPDLLGLAIRVPTAGEPIDLLLTTTGRGRLSRLVPVPRTDAATFYSTIMGYRSAAGSLRFAAASGEDEAPSDPEPQAQAVARSGLRFTVSVARALGPWQPFARLTLTDPVPSLDPDVRFDAVLHPPPGLVADGPMARFRAPAYARARVERDRR